MNERSKTSFSVNQDQISLETSRLFGIYHRSWRGRVLRTEKAGLEKWISNKEHRLLSQRT